MARQQSVVCGESPDGERFYFVTIDFELAEMVELSIPFTEPELRAELLDRGLSEAEIDRMITAARAQRSF